MPFLAPPNFLNLGCAGKTSPRRRRHGSSPQTQSMSWSLNVSGNKWQTGRSGRRRGERRVRLRLAHPPPCYIHSLLFTTVQKNKGGKRGLVCVHLCVCVCAYPHKRLCILFALFILPFISTVLFSAHYLMSCQGLSWVGERSTAQS